jgi:hypothetical protein
MKKYMTGGFESPIEEVEVVKETKKSVWVKREGWAKGTESIDRCHKRASWHNYFDTWEEAHAFLMDKAQREVDSLRRQLELAKGKLGNIKGMKNTPH